MGKKYKFIFLVLIDLALINISYLISFYFRFSTIINNEYINIYLRRMPLILSVYIICFYLFKLYESLWTIASIDEFMLGVAGCVVGSGVNLIISIMIIDRIPLLVTIMAGILNVMLVVGFRMSFRIYRRIVVGVSSLDKRNFQRVLIVGAGSIGNMVINEMRKHPEMKYNPVAIIDDNLEKVGTSISGAKVLGSRSEIKKVVEEKNIDLIVVAIPSLKVEGKKELIKLCSETKAKVKIIPGVYELIDEKTHLTNMRDVDLKDLLGREPVKLDVEGISEYIKGKVVLVTGGGGSIGSELCRQIASYNPSELLILDIYENSAYEIQNELSRKYPCLNHKVLIASVRDRRRIEKIFQQYKPQVVFHAAAHKHVPLMEFNPIEAVKNNVFGTLNVAECSGKYGVKKFVLISTDKAVNPTNIMGATKRICEMIIQAMNKISSTEFVAVRFGNVLGSNGSVIPLFKKQIEEGGPVTVTHPEITRYFMLIPEAVQLVLQAGTFARGGEIFVLDMGEPVKIYDLACELIRLSGYEPNKDIEIKFTGLRPGEKLYEELLMAEEGLKETRHEKIFIGRPTFVDMNKLKKYFKEIRFIVEHESQEELIRKIQELVVTYKRVEYHLDNTEKLVDEKYSEDDIISQVSATLR
ncbi:polysaccharide biosynthesis protein [Clostridium polyendosporum]|nr:nucleoside-diphosphate sugar epimerase/dehydratase [Clostridium polyendosporum]